MKENSVKNTSDNCVARIEMLRRQHQVGEFGDKDFHSMKSIIVQIEQNGILSPRNKIASMIDLLVRVEEFFQ